MENIENANEPRKLKDKRLFFAGLAMMFVAIGVVYYSLYVSNLMHSVVIPGCPVNDTKIVAQSQLAFSYAVNPAHWGNLTVHMEELCNTLKTTEAGQKWYPH